MADQGTEGALSPFLRSARLSAVKPFIDGKVLDFGCGSGALAGFVSKDNYVGVDINSISLAKARTDYPNHVFVDEIPEGDPFQTIVSLAVIEHVKNPAKFLQTLAASLSEHSTARIIVSTPHPSMDWIHDLGASIGLFSSHANEEHESLLERQELQDYGEQAGMNLEHYSRFLFGANQLAIYSRNQT